MTYLCTPSELLLIHFSQIKQQLIIVHKNLDKASSKSQSSTSKTHWDNEGRQLLDSKKARRKLLLSSSCLSQTGIKPRRCMENLWGMGTLIKLSFIQSVTSEEIDTILLDSLMYEVNINIFIGEGIPFRPRKSLNLKMEKKMRG